MSDVLIYEILEVVVVIFEVFTIQLYVNGFLGNDLNMRNSLWGYSIFGAGLVLLSLFYPVPIILISYIMAGILTLEFIYYKGNRLTKLFAALFYAILMIASDTVCAGLVSTWGGIPIDGFQEYGLQRALFVTVAKIVQLMMVKILCLLVNWKNVVQDQIAAKGALPLIMCQVFSIMLLHYNFINAYRTDDRLTIPLFLSIIGILYINLVVFWYFDRVKIAYTLKHENELVEERFRYQQKYYKVLEEYQHETEALWHDMKKHMSTIKELQNMDLKNEAEQYIHILDDKIEEMPKIVRTAIPEINAILVDELQKAENENIDVQLDINVTNTLKISIFDFCILLGNTFENAIDACSVLPLEAERVITIKILQNDDVLLIDVINPFDPDAVSAPRSGRKHGYGMRNIQEVVKKYGGDMDIKTTDNLFQISIIIP